MYDKAFLNAFDHRSLFSWNTLRDAQVMKHSMKSILGNAEAT